ncbi:hypothetical protein, partial [uncultured Proteiniphilum sp.]|uniref:hypothetical protein n=1 Tax=uncultured Proteiniphilum sp. TaxID=497637 RepID=UPI00261FD322
ENIEADYNQPVSLKIQNGYIEAVPVTPTQQNTKLQLLIPTQNGKTITMVDYASVNNWDNGNHVCTWLPIDENQ